MDQFIIHPQLLLDTHYLGKFPSSHVLLHKNAVLPWFILVPETAVIDLLDLPDELRRTAMDEAAIVAAFVKRTFGCARVNFASIGNVVPQLHLHIVGRSPNDPCWPAPVWGNLRETREYSAAEVSDIIGTLQRCLPVEFVAR
ncbi:MAG: HIT family protein [Candidatus Binatia bacterium]